MEVLFESKRQYDYLTASIAQGLTQLGHGCYGYGKDFSNYLLPYEGSNYDIIIQATEITKIQSNKPRIYLQGSDLGIGSEMDNMNYRNLKYNIGFIRDLRATFDERRFVYPINFGVEDRYFCKTRYGYKKLNERKYDIMFAGGLDKGIRQKAINAIKENFSDKSLLLGGRMFRKPDEYWSTTTKTFCPHDENYFEALADSKVVLSFMGAGPDCARHWEALASGGVPFIERMPSLMCPPELKNQRECILFSGIEDLIKKLYYFFKEEDKYQEIADKAYYMAKNYHSTKARSMYMLTKCMEAGVI